MYKTMEARASISSCSPKYNYDCGYLQGSARRLMFSIGRTTALISVVLFALSGCGGGGGKAADEVPIAAALVVGQGVNQVQVTVRSGSEVILNGENSDGTRFPIATATWVQTDSGGAALSEADPEFVRLDKRTELTRAFRVPMFDFETTLTFELTITNTDGEVSKTEVTINIIPRGDSDRFLEYFSAIPNLYTVVAVLNSGITATSDVNFTITSRQLVNYADRLSGDNTPNQFDLEIASREIRSSLWPSGTSATWMSAEQAANAFYHPNFCFTIPKLDLDDINAQFDDTDPPMGIDEHRVDSVQQFVELTLEVTGGSCRDSGGASVDCQQSVSLVVLDANNNEVPATGANPAFRTILVDTLKASTDMRRLPESALTAAAYYRAVDPNDRRTRLSDWLTLAGFTDVSGQPIDAPGEVHNAIYINNYDLGFTRDMFVRKDPVTGNVYTYVVNLPALRPAILRHEDSTVGDENVVATVVMEYSPAEEDPMGPAVVDANKKFTKFFVFMPDQQGDQVRVNSLNFDGRGEKWVPGACTPCHGGNAEPLTPFDGELVYPGHGDIDAAFLPWDLDSFLYVKASNKKQVDPLVTEAFNINPGYLTEQQLEQYSRQNQEAAFRGMNEAVMTTLVDPSGSNRFGTGRKLLEGQ